MSFLKRERRAKNAARRQVVEPFFLSNGAIAVCACKTKPDPLNARCDKAATCAAAQTADALLWLLRGWMIFYVLRAAAKH
jgi:hypothetical protein